MDFVQDKSTLARVTVAYLASPTQQASVTVTAYFEGNSVQDTQTLNGTETKTFSLFFLPDEAGSDKNITVIATTTDFTGFNNDSATVFKDVVQTRQLNLTFVPLFGPQNFNKTKADNLEFLNRTYPVSDSGIVANVSEGPLEQVLSAGAGGACLLLYQVTKDTVLFSAFTKTSFERTVVILPKGWVTNTFGSIAAGANGIYCGPLPLVAFEEGFRHGAAHEIGHSYGLCDEYNADTWAKQNNPFPLITNLCPNGDLNNDEQLDFGCPTTGCPTSTVLELAPWALPPTFEEDDFFNFMGGSGPGDADRWVTNESYTTLLKLFSHNSPESATQRLLVSGIVNKTSGQIQFDPFYTLGSGSVDNVSEFTSGNYTIETLDNIGNKILNLSFNLSFQTNFINGPTVDINASPFLFIIPFNSSVAQILIKTNQTINNQINVSANSPSVNITFPTGGESFSNKFNVSWSASDPDGGNLSYAILFSSDNGSTLSSLKVDYNQTIIEIDSTNLSDCKSSCKVMVLATDGVKTSNSTSNSFSLDNNLNITSLKIVYANQTQRVFEIRVNNTVNFPISNISWSLDTENGIKTSSIAFNLNASEKIVIYAYHNYSIQGNFNAIATIKTDLYTESETIAVNT